MPSSLIESQLKGLPNLPGVYLMRDSRGNILYVGKATSLHQRVRSYFQSPSRLTPKIQRMVSQVADIDFYVASSEQEALIMELNFIKQYHPRYNVHLKDDKTFPYLKVTLNEAWPRVLVTRRYEQDGGRYFGPFASARSVKQTLRILQRLFPFRVCQKDITGRQPRPCLEHYLGRCLAPCAGRTDREEYGRVIQEVLLFLEGKQDTVIRQLRERMNRAAAAMDYEKAGLIRDQIRAIQDVIEGERIAAAIRGEEDVIAFVQDGDQAYVQVLFIRGNRLTGKESFLLQGTREVSPRDIMTSFVKQYYSSCPQIPPLLLLQYPVEDRELIEEWLQGRRGGKVKIIVPRRGLKKQVVEIASENARQGAAQVKIKELAAPQGAEEALIELAKVLGLPAPPGRIEAYDISNVQGASAVGSMVVFEKGRPRPAYYRRFRIRTVTGANDYAMLEEVLRRRLQRLQGSPADRADAWTTAPDLILIDGGKGQLNAALAVLREMNYAIPALGLAKENEEIFLPDRKDPLVLPKSSPGLQLLQRVRDEAHRFAVSYFSSLHRRRSFTSALDAIPGIGPRRKTALLRHFGSIQAIREASLEELMAATGLSREQAGRIRDYL